jgi:hypothetical protein
MKVQVTGSGARRRPLLFAGVAVLAAAGIATPAAAGAAGSAHHRGANAVTPDHGHAASHRLDHVFVIMEENHAEDHVIGDRNMPFTNQLAHTYGMATNYYGVTHTSEPNYIAATSGSNWDINNDNGWAKGNRYDHTNLVDELTAHHIPWAAYMDGMPSAGYLPDSWPSSKNALYASKHNPFVLYNDVRENPSRLERIKPIDALAADLNSRDAPRYVWISPDMCDDMHGGVYSAVAGHPETPCPYSNTAGDANDEALKAKADSFLRRTVETIMHSRAWTGNSVIFVTADETDYDGSNADNGYYLSTAGCCDSPVLPAGDPAISPKWPGGVYGGGLVPMIVISRNGPRHVTDATAYNHYSMLATIEDGFGLGLLGNTSDTIQVKPMWPLVAPARR